MADDTKKTEAKAEDDAKALATIDGLSGGRVIAGVGIYDGEARVKAAAEDARQRFEVELGYADGSSDDEGDGQQATADE